MKKLLLTAALLPMLGACAQSGGLQPPVLQPTVLPVITLDQIRTVSSADLAAAEAKATAAGDDAGAICWKKLSTIPSAPGTATGLASLTEDARIAQQAVSGACAGLLAGIIAAAAAIPAIP